MPDALETELLLWFESPIACTVNVYVPVPSVPSSVEDSVYDVSVKSLFVTFVVPFVLNTTVYDARPETALQEAETVVLLFVTVHASPVGAPKPAFVMLQESSTSVVVPSDQV